MLIDVLKLYIYFIIIIFGYFLMGCEKMLGKILKYYDFVEVMFFNYYVEVYC